MTDVGAEGDREAGAARRPPAAIVTYRVEPVSCEPPSGYAGRIHVSIERSVNERASPDTLPAWDVSSARWSSSTACATAFGKAGPAGLFWRTRADDMAVKVVRELLRRNPSVEPERIGDVILAATAQVGDQGLTLGRDVALLAGLPHTVPGFAIDRMCAGALTATTAGAGEIAMGAADVVIVGGVEHMGHHAMGEEVDFNPRFVSERLIDESAAVMGQTAENLHDAFPQLTREAADTYALESQMRAGRAWEADGGVMARTVVPMSVFGEDGWRVAARDEFLRPDTTLEGLAGLRTPFRAGGRVTAGNSAGLTDGATAALLTAESVAAELGSSRRCDSSDLPTQASSRT